MSSIWADTTLADLQKRVVVLEAQVTELVAHKAALLATLEEWRTLLEAEHKSLRADFAALTPAPVPPPRQVNGRRG